jgi:hypothetical protein
MGIVADIVRVVVLDKLVMSHLPVNSQDGCHEKKTDNDL